MPAGKTHKERILESLKRRREELEPLYIRAKQNEQEMLAENARLLKEHIMPLLKQLDQYTNRNMPSETHALMFLGALNYAYEKIEQRLLWPSDIIKEFQEINNRIILMQSEDLDEEQEESLLEQGLI